DDHAPIIASFRRRRAGRLASSSVRGRFLSYRKLTAATVRIRDTRHDDDTAPDFATALRAPDLHHGKRPRARNAEATRSTAIASAALRNDTSSTSARAQTSSKAVLIRRESRSARTSESHM